MANNILSLGELRRKSAVTDDAVNATVAANLDDAVTGDFRIGAYMLDPAEAVLASKFATDMLARSDA